MSRVALGLSLFLPFGCRAPAPPAEPPAPVASAPSLQAEVDAIFDAWFRAQPVTATSLGDHRFDDRWPDLSASGLAADATRIADALRRLEAHDGAGLDVDASVDRTILRSALLQQQFAHEVERPWRNDPLWYAQLLGTGLEELVSRAFAPVGERASDAAARLEALPGVLERARENLDAKACMRPHTEVAIGQLRGLMTLVKDVIPERLADAPPTERARIAAAGAPAVAAIEAFADWLQAEVLPVAAGDWRLGPEQFERKLALTLQSDISADEVRRLAVIEHGRVRSEMAALARDLGPTLLAPAELRKIARAPDPDMARVTAVLEALARAHTTPAALRDSIESTLQRLTAFVRTAKLVPLDDAEVLEVIWTPEHQRGVFIAGLAAPGALEPVQSGLPSFYLVQPIPSDWSTATAESFLREYNDFMLEILSIHEAIPGHFVQLYYGKREPSKVRRALANGPFVEGWAVYAEKVMVDAGYAGARPTATERPAAIDKRLWTVMTDESLRRKAIALHRLKFYLRTVTNALLDHSIHAGDMSREEALTLMIERSFQQAGEAQGKWVRAQVTSTQLSTYFVGALGWMRLREQAEARAKAEGRPFDASAFHAAALSHGAPPVPMLPQLLGWAAPAAQSAASP